MKKYVMPPKIRQWKEGNWSLYFDPHNFVWVKVNESGTTLMDMLIKHYTLKQMIEQVMTKFAVSEEKARNGVNGFINSISASGFLHINKYKERDRAEFPALDFPHDIYVHLTNKCNLKCPYCYNKDDRENKLFLEKAGLVEPTLNTEEYKKLISRLIDCGVKKILFTGGEPLMRPDFVELITFARNYNQEVLIEILTNAILIDDEMADHLCKNVNGVTISLDGHEKHMHEHFRGKNTFAPTIKGIRKVVARKKELGLRAPYICTVPALTNLNIINLKDIFEYSMDDLGVDGLAPIIFQAGDHQEVSLTQIPELNIYLEAMKQTREYIAERNQRLGNEVSTAAGAVGPRNHCGVGHGEISIDPGGFVYPCQSLHFDEYICGNVREDDIKEIFHSSPVMKKVRGTTVDAIDVCKHCDLKYVCNAGCRATAYNVYRQFDSHNEIYCKFLETMAVGRLWGDTHVSLSPN